MISKLSEKAVDVLSVHNCIAQEEKELYVYGFFMLFSKAFFLLLTVIYGVLFGVVLESVLFYITFTVLRSYAGGIHASKESTCTICTSLAMLLCVAAIRVCVELSLLAVPFVLLALSTICILILSPLDSAEKRLMEEEKKEYRKKTYRITTLIVSAAILALICGLTRLFYPCVTSLMLESLLLVAGKAKGVLSERI